MMSKDINSFRFRSLVFRFAFFFHRSNEISDEREKLYVDFSVRRNLFTGSTFCLYVSFTAETFGNWFLLYTVFANGLCAFPTNHDSILKYSPKPRSSSALGVYSTVFSYADIHTTIILNPLPIFQDRRIPRRGCLIVLRVWLLPQFFHSPIVAGGLTFCVS
jgi:hypothetical protein